MSRNIAENELDETAFQAGTFKPIRFIFIILLVMLSISQSIKWYSQSVSLPRFCNNPEMALHYLEEILSKPAPAAKGYKARKPYIIAAKLIYLVPQKSNEKNEKYIQRVRGELSKRCLL